MSKTGQNIYKNEMNTNVLMKEIARKWLHSKREHVKASSFCRYEHVVHKYIIPRFGKYVVSEISKKELQDFIDDLQERGLSKSTIQGIIQHANQIIDFAKIEEETKYASASKGDMELVSSKELKRFIQFLRIDCDESKLGILLVIYTGLKVGELCALKWGDIDIEKSEMVINKTIQRIQDTSAEELNRTRIVITEVTQRVIPIPSILLDVLTKYKGKDNEFVLSSNSKKFLEPRVMQYRLDAFCRESKIRRASFSMLRDTFAVRALELGIDTRVVAEVLGIDLENMKKYIPYIKKDIDKAVCMEKMNGI